MRRARRDAPGGSAHAQARGDRLDDAHDGAVDLRAPVRSRRQPLVGRAAGRDLGAPGATDARHVPWLAERVAKEKPFVGYHAAIALLAAARTLPEGDLPQVGEVVSSHAPP